MHGGAGNGSNYMMITKDDARVARLGVAED